MLKHVAYRGLNGGIFSDFFCIVNSFASGASTTNAIKPNNYIIDVP